MQIVGYQLDCYDKLYEYLVDEKRNLILCLGNKGCGKSTIIGEIANVLKETWKVFLLSGTGVTSPPYYTWYAAQETIKSTKSSLSDISFGINFQPIGLPVGVNLNIGLVFGNIMFNVNEQSILNEIKRTAVDDNILFIAEDYNAWDQSSKELLQKIIKCKNEIFQNEKSIQVVLVDSHFDLAEISRDFTDDYIEICISDYIKLEDIVNIINQKSEIKALQIVDIKSIVSFTGYDLRLINLAVCYQQNNNDLYKINSLKDLLDKRIEQLPDEQKIVCETLRHVSIINTLFTEREAAYLLDKELLYAERMLHKAVDLQFIRKQNTYDFPNPEIQKYFIEKLNIEKKYLHYKFAKYLQIYYPEDYLSRAYHLYQSEDAYQDNSAVDSAYLTAIEIERRREITIESLDSVVKNQLNDILKELPALLAHNVNTNIEIYFLGNSSFMQCNYSDAIAQFAGLYYAYASKVFTVEVKRLHLLSLVQLADNLHEIKKLSDDLFAEIQNADFLEDEVWCRTALILLEVFGDRHVQTEKFNQLISGFESRIRKHMSKKVFNVLYAKYACKSSLFFNSLIATKLTEESCKFFREYNCTLNLYFSLCNNAANSIVCGEYLVAEMRLKECNDIILENPKINFPSTYKIKNNIIINTFLKSEGTLFEYSTRKRTVILSAANEAIYGLEKLKNRQRYEVSHVIEFNLLSMYVLCNMTKKISELIQNFETEYLHLDAFYRYYYHNIRCAISILSGNFIEANIHLDSLITLNVVLLSYYSTILNKRNQIIKQLIDEKFQGDGFSYNYEFVKRGIRVQDRSASFWGRGLLLSDLQFLTL